MYLIRLIEEREIRQALFSIEDRKSPGVNGLNSLFYIKNHGILLNMIWFELCRSFFYNGFLLKEMNGTSVSLIPKVEVRKSIKEFSPIAYCNVCYKIISKILNSRLDKVIAKMVTTAQLGFITGKLIADNILL